MGGKGVGGSTGGGRGRSDRFIRGYVLRIEYDGEAL